MESKEINELAKAAKDGKITVTILKGDAEKFLEPVKPIQETGLVLFGTMGTVSEFMSKRSHLYDPEKCNIRVEENRMTFTGNECSSLNKLPDSVSGSLEFSEEFMHISLNDENQEFKPKELANYLRRRQNLFSNVEQFKAVWGALSQFESTINKKVESADDRTGNMRESIQQEVVHNIPKDFKLSIQVFKDAPRINIEVEVDVNPHNLNCSLMSFDIDEKIEQQRKELIDNELQQDIGEGVKLIDYCVVYFC